MPRSPDLPCADCGKLMWRNHRGERHATSLPAGRATCQPCRRVRREAAQQTKVARQVGRMCEVCGQRYRHTHTAQRTCGRTCGAALWKANRPPQYPTTPVRYADCRGCGTVFACRPGSAPQFCGLTCYGKATQMRLHNNRMKRRARIREVTHEDYDPIQVFKRDRWRCRLCGKRVDRRQAWPHPMTPTIDHLVPISKGGDDVKANVITAHLRCNLMKGNRGGGEQLALIG